MFKFLSAEPDKQHFCSETACGIEVDPNQTHCYWCSPVALSDHAPTTAVARAEYERATETGSPRVSEARGQMLLGL